MGSLHPFSKDFGATDSYHEVLDKKNLCYIFIGYTVHGDF